MPLNLSPQSEKPSAVSHLEPASKWRRRLLGVLAALLLACLWVLLSANPAIAI